MEDKNTGSKENSTTIFENVYSGIENMHRGNQSDSNQISIFDYDEDFNLPEIDTSQADKKIKKTKTKKTSSYKKKASIDSNKIEQVDVTNKQSNKEDTHQEIPNINTIKVVDTGRQVNKTDKININNIKTVEENNKNKSQGTGFLYITGAEQNDSMLGAVANKSKKLMDDRNAELMKFRNHPYQRKDILTEAEKKLYKFLRQRLPEDALIFPKVRLADVVELIEQLSRDQKSFYKIACKHLDFLIVGSDLNLICAVELDDYTHETEKARQRDQFVAEVLRDCGIPFYRIGCRIDTITTEHTKEIEMCVLEYLAPTCPMCGRPMMPRTSKKAANFGHRFYGCTGYAELGANKCCYTIDID